MRIEGAVAGQFSNNFVVASESLLAQYKGSCAASYLFTRKYPNAIREFGLVSRSQTNLHQRTDVAFTAIELARATDNRGQVCETGWSESEAREVFPSSLCLQND